MNRFLLFFAVSSLDPTGIICAETVPDQIHTVNFQVRGGAQRAQYLLSYFLNVTYI